jgi:hypothetical protein
VKNRANEPVTKPAAAAARTRGSTPKPAAKRAANAPAPAKRGAKAPAKRDAPAPAKRGAKAPAKRDAPAPAKRGAKAPAKRDAKAPAKRGAKAPAKRGAKASARARRPAEGASLATLRVKEIDALRSEIAKKSAELVPRWNADPEDVQKSVAQLVLALVEFLRKLLERQAIRRMEAETLSPDEIERVGLALMRLEETVRDLAARFGLDPEELNLDLGPLGRLT